jgi:hypothetical protein
MAVKPKDKAVHQRRFEIEMERRQRKAAKSKVSAGTKKPGARAGYR